MHDRHNHVRRNREMWDGLAKQFAVFGERNWEQTVPTWGIWNVSESMVEMFPDDIAGKDVIELGCGTAYISAWLARRGARVVGIDNSAAQLATAHRLQRQYDLHFPLVHANAEKVPLADARFDFAISEYGACLWADPRLWVPEASRLLRPGGRLVFLVNSFILMLCMPEQDGKAADEKLLRPAFGMNRVEWPDEIGVEFHLSHGDWITLLRRSCFEIEELVEIRPEESAATSFPYVTLEWARKWPCEEVWKVRKK